MHQALTKFEEKLLYPETGEYNDEMTCPWCRTPYVPRHGSELLASKRHEEDEHQDGEEERLV